MIRAWRLTQARHAAAAMTGDGARLYGGRWNSRGAPVIYTASSLALAALEIMVALKDLRALRENYVALAVDIPGRLVERLEAALLPDDWTSPEHPTLKRLGDQWLRDGRTAVLEVPSAVVPMESNYLLNPLHRNFPAVRTGAPQSFAFDPRLTRGVP